MNSIVGPILIVTAAVCWAIVWFIRWKGERRYMREYREKNRRDSYRSLTDSWKANAAWVDNVSDLQARRREMEADSLKKQTAAYYTKMESEEVIGERKQMATLRSYANQNELTIEEAAAKLESEKLKTTLGLGLNMNEIAEEYGLSLEELKEAYRKAESMVGSGNNVEL